MESLLGVPTTTLTSGAAFSASAVVLLLLVAALRRPLLLRLALRNPGRRPAQALLITLGLTMSAVIVGTAFNTGDTMTHAVRSLVASGLGRADEVVVALPREQRRSPSEYLTALLNGTLLTGLGSYFPEERAAALAARVANEPTIAGLTPAIGEQVTIVNQDAQTVQAQIGLLALPPDYPPVFGQLVSQQGEVLSLSDLEHGQVLANMEAAAQLGGVVGSRLEVRARDRSASIQLRGIVHAAELGGAQPAIYLPLAHYQRLTGREGQVNQVLIANQGESTTSVRLSGEVSRVLRAALADRAAATRLFELLRGEAAQGEIAREARLAEGRPREKLQTLLRTLREDHPSDEFTSLATDPDLERRLFGLAARLGGEGSRGLGSIPEISSLRVVEVKQASQDQADRWGGALTSTFLIMGLFSLATGSLLVFLIFTTLAAERRAELGVLRALGARRRDVILLFLMEGAIYDLLGSALGVALGIAIAIAIANAGDASLAQYGLRLEPRLEARSLVLAYCLGLLLTFVSVAYSAWHISRLSVVNAIRNLPDPSRRRRVARGVLPSLLLLVVGPLLAWFGSSLSLALPQALGVAFTLVGGGLLVRPVLERVGVSRSTGDRWAYSLCGVGLLAYWLSPSEWTFLSPLRVTPRSVDLFFLAGLSMVLGAVWLVVHNLSMVTGPLVRTTAGLKSVGLAVRIATAHPLDQLFRTGMVVSMFALVIFTMVVASVMLTATHRAYNDPEALAGGFDLRAELTPVPSSFDLATTLPTAVAVKPDDFVAVGRLATRPAQAIELGPGAHRWQPYTLQEIDSGFAEGVRSPLAARARGLDSDAEVWNLVTTEPGYAVISGSAARARQAGAATGAAFQLAEVFLDGSRFDPAEVWVRDNRSGAPVKITIVGVLDPRVSFPAGIYTSRATLDPSGAGSPQRVVYYLKARPEADPNTLALGLNLSFNERGLRASAIGEEIRQIQSVRSLLNQLLQGFFGVGLLAGLAAVGVIGMRAVVERRQQIGVLRALGFRREMVRLSLLLETSLLALLGIGVGVSLGLALSRRLIDYLGRQYPEIVFSVPREQIGLLGLGIYLAALLLTALPIWQIGRVEPAEAMAFE